MRQVPFVALLGIAVLLFVGCGDDGGGGGDSGSKTQASEPESLLVTATELPEGTVTGEAPPSTCGPLPILEENGGRIALSKMFDVGSARMVEAVGVFSTPAKAKSAFDDLNDPERLECITNAIRTFGSASEVRMARLRPLQVGDEGAVVRYATFDEDEPTGYSDVVALRADRCTASLLIAIGGDDPPNVISGELTEVVVRRLSKACGS